MKRIQSNSAKFCFMQKETKRHDCTNCCTKSIEIKMTIYKFQQVTSACNIIT